MNFAIIGSGYIAKKAFIPAIKSIKGCSLLGILNNSAESTIKDAKTYDCKPYNDINSLLNDNNLDAIYISTPPKFHEYYCILASRIGLDILCEKPLSTSLKNVKNIVGECKKNKTLIMEGFMYQYHPQHNHVKRLINERRLGKPHLFEAKFGFPPFANPDNFRYKKELGGGALLDAGVYTIHSARKFFEAEPINIFSVSKREDGVDRHGSAILNFGNNQSAHISYGFNNYYQNTYSIWLERGYLKVNRAYSIPNDLCAEIILHSENAEKKIIIDCADQFILQLKAFINIKRDLKETEKMYEDALNQAAVVDKIYNS